MAGRATKIDNYFKAVFSTPEGKTVLKEIEEHCGVGKELWAKEQLTQNANCTKHDVAVWIRNKTKGQ